MSSKQRFWRHFCLSTNVVTFASTQIFLFTIFPVIAERLHLSLSEVAATFSLGTFCFLWGSPFWSLQSDKIGRWTVMIIGLMGLAVSWFLLWALMYTKIFNQYALLWLLISRVVYGLVASAIVPVAQLARFDATENNDSMKASFAHSLALSSGRSVGPLLVLLAGSHLNYLMLAVIFWMIVLILTNLSLPKLKLHTHAQGTAEIAAFSWKSSLQNLRWPVLIVLAFASYTGALYSTLAPLLQTKFQLTGLDAGRLMASMLLSASLMMALAQWLIKKINIQRWQTTLQIGTISLCMGACLLVLMNHLSIAWLAITLIAVGMALIYPSCMSLVHQISSPNQLGRNVGSLTTTNTFGNAVGGALVAMTVGASLSYMQLTLLLMLLTSVYVTIKKYSLQLTGGSHAVS